MAQSKKVAKEPRDGSQIKSERLSHFKISSHRPPARHNNINFETLKLSPGAPSGRIAILNHLKDEEINTPVPPTVEGFSRAAFKGDPAAVSWLKVCFSFYFISLFHQGGAPDEIFVECVFFCDRLIFFVVGFLASVKLELNYYVAKVKAL